MAKHTKYMQYLLILYMYFVTSRNTLRVWFLNKQYVYKIILYELFFQVSQFSRSTVMMLFDLLRSYQFNVCILDEI